MSVNHKKSATIKHMTEGNPLHLILFFAIPLMAGNMFQQLYTVTDTAIIGRALGVEALAALGTVEWFSWMSLGMIQGISQGFSILVSQNFGASQYKELRKTVGNACVLAALSSIILLLIMEAMVNPMFVIMHAPTEVIPIAGLYLRIMFCGIPIVMAYNMVSSFLRALGDSKSPLYAMIVASIVNIGLDSLFVLVFHWGVAGAAVATLIAQLVATFFCLVKIKNIQILHINREDLQLNKDLDSRLFRLASPMAFQNLVIAVGGMIVQSVVNHYGVIFIAGYTATNRLYGLLEIAAISYGFAMTTYTGQNMGAGNKNRISEGIRAGLLIGLLTSLVIAILMFVLGQQILGCFIDVGTTDGNAAMVIAYGYLKIMAIFLPVLYILHIVRSCIQGMGNTVIPMLSGVSEFIMRTGSALLMPILMGEWGILYAEIIAWIGADLILVPGYFVERKKLDCN